jgi:hypothetical protein
MSNNYPLFQENAHILLYFAAEKAGGSSTSPSLSTKRSFAASAKLLFQSIHHNLKKQDTKWG